jgi:hypothetical protein
MALSMAVVTNSKRLFNHPLEISNTFASVKRKAKAEPGSAICFDQRRSCLLFQITNFNFDINRCWSDSKR